MVGGKKYLTRKRYRNVAEYTIVYYNILVILNNGSIYFAMYCIPPSPGTSINDAHGGAQGC